MFSTIAFVSSVVFTLSCVFVAPTNVRGVKIDAVQHAALMERIRIAQSVSDSVLLRIVEGALPA